VLVDSWPVPVAFIPDDWQGRHLLNATTATNRLGCHNMLAIEADGDLLDSRLKGGDSSPTGRGTAVNGIESVVRDHCQELDKSKTGASHAGERSYHW
jgi:hypothetical protein